MVRLIGCSLLAVSLLAATPAHAQNVVTFHVATNGNDAWSGRLADPAADGQDGPFRTVARARDVIRGERGSASGATKFNVLLREGTHFLNETLMLMPEDSGAETAPVTYAAYRGERPILSGGRPITGWRRGTGEPWVAEIPAAKAGKWVFRQLFVDGQRRTRARHPNERYLWTAGPLPEIEDPHKMRGKPEARVGFTFRKGDIQRWPDLDEANIVLYHDWSTSRHWIKSLDETKRTVRFTNLSSWPVCFWEREQRYHVENVRSALDQPGEWYLDRETGTLSYWPMPGEDMTKAEVIAPVVEHLVELRGEPAKGQLVQHIRFEGLSFQHAQWRLGRTDRTQAQAAVYLTAALFARGAQHCALERCEVAHVGGYAIWFEQGAKHNQIVQCEVRDLGGGGIRLGEAGYQGDEALQTTHNTIDNCFIHHAGSVFPDGVGVWIGHSGHNRVTHNEISDLIYTGISAGWRWHYGAHGAHHNTIEWNHIHHLGFGVLSELSAIYTLGEMPGTVIRNNLLHDTFDYKFGSWGLGLDQGTSGTLVENNILYNHGHGIGLHYGKNNVVRNNIVAFCRQNMLGIGRVEDHLSMDFHHNIVYGTQGTVARGNWTKAKLKSDYNCYWHTDMLEDLEVGDWAFDEWQKQGHDQHSVVADPQFVNAAELDFRVRPDSPALKFGFRPIDLTGVGLYGPAEWVEAPNKIERAPIEVTAAKQRPPDVTTITDDFEDTAVGGAATGATTSGEDNGASIRVTDEVAAGGRHCLKFTDAPGLKHTWEPHLFYTPHVRRGTARLSFDIRLEQGATLVHQWRDWRGSQFQCGPTLLFKAGGKLVASEKTTVCDVPAGKWTHVEIACPLGRKPDRTYTLVATVERHAPVRAEKLPLLSQRFCHLTWIGFISEATDTAVVYLDNVHLSPDAAEKSPLPGIGP